MEPQKEDVAMRVVSDMLSKMVFVNIMGHLLNSVSIPVVKSDDKKRVCVSDTVLVHVRQKDVQETFT